MQEQLRGASSKGLSGRRRSASDKDLAKLPGVTPNMATAIIAKRPYVATHDLVRKRVMSAAEFDKIKNLILVK